MRRSIVGLVVLIFVLSSLPAPKPVLANSEEDDGGPEPPHRIEVFLGGTQAEESLDLAVGLSYEYRLSRLFGLGAFLEYADKEDGVWVFAAPVYLHPYKGFRFLLAPGVEREVSKNRFLFRAGVAYEIEIRRWSIAPEFNVDLPDGGPTALVFGVSFGYAF
jgi:hypothetical protein